MCHTICVVRNITPTIAKACGLETVICDMLLKNESLKQQPTRHLNNKNNYNFNEMATKQQPPLQIVLQVYNYYN
eukprot:m.28707 g.28707  ORF g.28707 m.28707 type:complete len:74 (+) comp8026_c0_seq2:1255-1476(+)